MQRDKNNKTNLGWESEIVIKDMLVCILSEIITLDQVGGWNRIHKVDPKYLGYWDKTLWSWVSKYVE